MTGDPVGTDTGNDVILGDNGSAVFETSSGDSILTHIETSDPEFGSDDFIFASDGSDIVFGGSGSDYVDAGTDQSSDIVVGDNGVVNFDAAGLITDVTTTVPGTGGDDVILVGDGDDVVLGGIGTDYVNIDPVTGDPVGTDTGNDVIIGDNGLALFDTASGQSIQTFIESIDHEYGSDDFIFSDGGSDVVLGGSGNDNLISGTGDDTVLGDNGEITYTDGLISEVLSTDILDETIGDDEIDAGDGNDMVLGGIGKDIIDGGEGNDILMGDNGRITLIDGIPSKVTSDFTSPLGGADEIIGGNGDDILLGGAGSDTVLGNSGFDILFGDSGTVDFSGGQPILGETIQSSSGATDFLDGGDGTDVLFGGEGTDTGVGEFPIDALVGEYGRVVIENGKVISIFPPIQMLFGNPAFGGIWSVLAPGFSGLGPVVTGAIGTGASTGTPGSPSTGFGRGFSHNSSYGISTVTPAEPEGFSEPEEEEGLPPDASGVISVTLPDGSIERTFPNGVVETLKPDGTVITVAPDGTITISAPDGTITMISPDGTRSTAFSNGIIIKILPDGTIIKTLPDGTVITTLPDGRETKVLKDGSTIITAPEGLTSLDSSLNTRIFERTSSEFRQNKDGLKRGSEFDIENIELGSVVAGLTGWGLASSRASKGKSALNRDGFKKLDREREFRRFQRWSDGGFENFVQERSSWTKRDEGPLNNFPKFNLTDRRNHGNETRD